MKFRRSGLDALRTPEVRRNIREIARTAPSREEAALIYLTLVACSKPSSRGLQGAYRDEEELAEFINFHNGTLKEMLSEILQEK